MNFKFILQCIGGITKVLMFCNSMFRVRRAVRALIGGDIGATVCFLLAASFFQLYFFSPALFVMLYMLHACLLRAMAAVLKLLIYLQVELFESKHQELFELRLKDILGKLCVNANELNENILTIYKICVNGYKYDIKINLNEMLLTMEREKNVVINYTIVPQFVNFLIQANVEVNDKLIDVVNFSPKNKFHRDLLKIAVSRAFNADEFCGGSKIMRKNLESCISLEMIKLGDVCLQNNGFIICSELLSKTLLEKPSIYLCPKTKKRINKIIKVEEKSINLAIENLKNSIKAQMQKPANSFVPLRQFKQSNDIPFSEILSKEQDKSTTHIASPSL